MNESRVEDAAQVIRDLRRELREARKVIKLQGEITDNLRSSSIVRAECELFRELLRALVDECSPKRIPGDKKFHGTKAPSKHLLELARKQIGQPLEKVDAGIPVQCSDCGREGFVRFRPDLLQIPQLAEGPFVTIEELDREVTP